MSGSSLDGLDLALCVFEDKKDSIDWQIVDALTVAFPSSLKSSLKNAAGMSGKELMKLDATLGDFIGEQISKWISGKDLKPTLIASHGHTVFHEPSEAFTTQIGSGAHIAAKTGIDTLVDFRQADVAQGGQGAPLAPIVDRDLLTGYDGYLNLGGIANVSLRLHDHDWKGWDICPCNQALNFMANHLGLEFDENGNFAKEGHVHQSLLDKLIAAFPVPNNHIFSISNEDVTQNWIAILENSHEAKEDLLATTSLAIAKLVVGHIASLVNNGKILVTGGGAHNTFLMQLLNEIGKEKHILFETPSPEIINYKECLLMAYLGYCTITNSSYRLHKITGARQDSIGGALYKALK